MGLKKQRKQVERLLTSAIDAAERAEKAADKARKQRKRAEAAADRASHEAPAQEAPAPSPASSTDEAAATPGGVRRTDLASATKAQLLDLARSAGVAGRSDMTKDELVTALSREG